VIKHELRDGSSEPDPSHRRVPDPSFDRRDARLSRQVRRDYRSHALVGVAEGHLKVRRPLQWAIRPGGGANVDKREKAVCPLSTTFCRSGPSRASIVPKSRPADIGRESCQSASAQKQTLSCPGCKKLVRTVLPRRPSPLCAQLKSHAQRGCGKTAPLRIP